MEASDLIDAFCEKVGVPPNANDDGTLLFESDDKLFWIHVLPEIDSVALVGDLGEAAPGPKEPLYRTMLEAQYLFASTFGSTISINPDNGRFMLCRVFSCKGLEVEQFIAAAEQFLSAQDSWFQIVRDYQPGLASSPDPAKDPGFDSMLAV